MKPIPSQVHHVINFLESTYGEVIDMDDVSTPDEYQRDQHFRTRALTALAIQHLAGFDADEAAACVVDGFDDQGIDGIAVAPDLRRVWIVQTKWSDQGRATLDQGAALKLLRGIEKLQDGEYDDFGDSFDRVRDRLDDAINTAGVRIAIVICLLGKQPPSAVIQADLQKFADEKNELSEMVELASVLFDDVYEIVKRGAADPRIDIVATLENWGQLAEPYQAYYGCVSVTDVARWYAESDERLFSKNIRRFLGLTEVNQKIQSSLRETPNSFWYLNNGITVLCDSIIKSFSGSGKASGTFRVEGASVVNGAQTVRSIYEVARLRPERVEDARVWLRLISLNDCPPTFAADVTEATNTQNQVEARDFVALDHVQAELREDFTMTLQKIYVIKRGESDPAPDAGCSVLEVARALACAQVDARFVARARHDSAVLWERGEGGTYDTLFARSPGAERAWQLVTFMRAVTGRLHTEERRREGRAQRVATLADFLITHILIRYAVRRDGHEPTPDRWDELLDLAGVLVDVLIMRIDLISDRGAVQQMLRDADRCNELASYAVAYLLSGKDAPELPLKYQTGAIRVRQRKPNVVTVLVDSTALSDGASLIFMPITANDRAAFAGWLAEDPSRGRATWVNNRSKPVLWEADGRRYSPTGLVLEMMRTVGIKVKAVQGTRYWRVAGSGSLVELADKVAESEAEDVDT